MFPVYMYKWYAQGMLYMYIYTCLHYTCTCVHVSVLYLYSVHVSVLYMYMCLYCTCCTCRCTCVCIVQCTCTCYFRICVISLHCQRYSGTRTVGVARKGHPKLWHARENRARTQAHCNDKRRLAGLRLWQGQTVHGTWAEISIYGTCTVWAFSKRVD